MIRWETLEPDQAARPRRSSSRRRGAPRRDLCQSLAAFAQGVIDNLARVGYLVLRALALICAALLLSLSTDQSEWMLLGGGGALAGLFLLFWKAADALLDLDRRRRWGR